MWFKTKFGLVHFEGSYTIYADCFTHPDGTKCVGLYAYQYVHPEYKSKRFLRSPTEIKNQSVYLAVFPEDATADRRVADCFGRIERAIRGIDEICDLSDIGTVESWGPAWKRYISLRSP